MTNIINMELCMGVYIGNDNVILSTSNGEEFSFKQEEILNGKVILVDGAGHGQWDTSAGHEMILIIDEQLKKISLKQD